ncbi:MAG: glycosyltransferase family 4 protein [Vicinamibacterales bacterium]
MAEVRPLRLAYVTIGRADDVREWSGLNAAIRDSLIQQQCVVEDVDQLGTSYSLRLRLRKRLHSSLFGTTYAIERSPVAAARWSRIAGERIAGLAPVDAVVSPGAMPVAFLGGREPLAIWADATFHSLREAYPEHGRYSRQSIEEGDRIETAALNRARLICFASDWAANDAVAYYGIARHKVQVIPFGANCPAPFTTAEAAARSVAQRDWSVTRFAFVGVDWHRKGGDLAVAIVRRLNERGTRSSLSVVGCKPPDQVADLPFVECHGFLSKADPVGHQRLHQILLASHFLLVPTLAECFGLVFAEASAYALPSISRAVGGVPSAVINGRTGVLCPADAGADAYCDALRPLLADRTRYAAMCGEAYRDYAGRLNWGAAGRRFVAALRAVLADRAMS